MPTRPIRISPAVEAALEARRPVVALESAVITAGLPREPLPDELIDDLPEWAAGGDAHVETALLLQRAVRAGGAEPATIAVIDGVLRVGLDEIDVRSLGAAPPGAKAAEADLAWALSAGATAGTTVSATLAACALARPRPIEVFATGGIGGVHRGWQQRPDVSADLARIARSRCCVVCSGAKAILDLPATIEALAALGAAVIGFETSRWPCFYAAGADAPPLAHSTDVPAQIARLCRHRWDDLDSGGVIVAVPVPPRWALRDDEVRAALEDAMEAAKRRAVTGPAVTPFLLAHIAETLGPRAVRANIALLERNARVAAAIACSGG